MQKKIKKIKKRKKLNKEYKEYKVRSIIISLYLTLECDSDGQAALQLGQQV
jgi:hypothetical protein